MRNTSTKRERIDAFDRAEAAFRRIFDVKEQ